MHEDHPVKGGDVETGGGRNQARSILRTECSRKKSLISQAGRRFLSGANVLGTSLSDMRRLSLKPKFPSFTSAIFGGFFSLRPEGLSLRTPYTAAPQLITTRREGKTELKFTNDWAKPENRECSGFRAIAGDSVRHHEPRRYRRAWARECVDMEMVLMRLLQRDEGYLSGTNVVGASSESGMPRLRI